VLLSLRDTYAPKVRLALQTYENAASFGENRSIRRGVLVSGAAHKQAIRITSRSRLASFPSNPQCRFSRHDPGEGLMQRHSFP